MIEDSHAGLGILGGSLPQGEVRAGKPCLGLSAALAPDLRPEPPAWGGLGRTGGWSSLQSRIPLGSGLSGHKQPQLSPRPLPAGVRVVLGSEECQKQGGL